MWVLWVEYSVEQNQYCVGIKLHGGDQSFHTVLSDIHSFCFDIFMYKLALNPPKNTIA